MNEHTPHTVTMIVKLGTSQQRNSGEYVPVGVDNQLIFALPCRNLPEASKARTKIIEALEQCLKQVKLEMRPTISETAAK